MENATLTTDVGSMIAIAVDASKHVDSMSCYSGAHALVTGCAE